MNAYWTVQLINAAILVAFGCLLMWRSRLSIRRRSCRITFAAANVPELARNQKEQRMQALKAELSQLERELSDPSGSAVTGA
jgi:hypothetical protein